MIRATFLLLLLFSGKLLAHCIVFIHIGPTLPEHLTGSIKQARLFNKDCPIYLIASQASLENQSSTLTEHNIIYVSCESLAPSLSHQEFWEANTNWTGGNFWIYTSERFFYLEEFVAQNQLQDVFHLESDMMLYADLEELLPTFRAHYEGMIGATFENDHRCVPGFMYISNSTPLTQLALSYPKQIDVFQSDMEALANFKNLHQKIYIDYLPIVSPEYSRDHLLEVFSQASKEPEAFSNHIADFDAIFDGAAWGIYLAGWDSFYHAECYPGVITPYSVFNPSFFEFRWDVDLEGRRIPVVTYNNKSMRLCNLHITNKIKIKDFSSK